MKTALVLIVTGLALMSFVSAEARPVRNSFINKRVASVQQLISHAQSDPEVMDRYRRHFGMTDTQVIAYFKTLRVSTLKETGYYRVYLVPDDGTIRSRMRKLKKGEPVFVDSEGRYILMEECGNPMTAGPLNPEANNRVDPVVAMVQNNDLREISQALVAYELFAEVPPIEPDVPPIPEETVREEPPVVIETGGGSPIAFDNLLGPLLGLGLLFSFDGGGGRNIPPPPPPAVPEPMTMLTMAAGLFGVKYLKRRRD